MPLFYAHGSIGDDDFTPSLRYTTGRGLKLRIRMLIEYDKITMGNAEKDVVGKYAGLNPLPHPWGLLCIRTVFDPIRPPTWRKKNE